MWESMDDETREVYGREYIDAHIRSAAARRSFGGADMTPVLDAMTDGLLAISPKSRYGAQAISIVIHTDFSHTCNFLSGSSIFARNVFLLNK